MIILIILTLTTGIFLGGFLNPELVKYSSYLSDISLYCILLISGILIGCKENIGEYVKKIGFRTIIVPISTIIGSVIGGALAGIILNYTWKQGASVGSGLGWYSLSGVIIAKHNEELGAVAFLSNIFRESIALITIPFIAKHIGYDEAVSSAGSTCMDTTLPVISKSTDSKTTLVALISGAILNFCVPFLVQFFIEI